MKSVSHRELERIIKEAFKKKLALMIWGSIGIGKSQSVRKVAQDIAKQEGLEFTDTNIEDGKFGFVDTRISQLDPSDLRGLPHIENNKTKWIPPNWLPQNPKGKGILFFDELNLAPPSIQASAYQLILDRRLGDYRLPDGWIIISAGNRIEDRANVFELPSPLANRFLHIELGIPNKDSWTEWALPNQIDTRIITWLAQRPSYLFKFDSKTKDKAFCTPRSWEFCSKLIKGVKDINLLENLIACAVGHATSIEFMSYLKLERKLDIDKILKNPQLVKDIKAIDIKYALISELAEHYRNDKTKKILPIVLQICSYLEPEFAILLLRFAKGIKPNLFVKDITKLKEWVPLSDRYAKYLL